MFIKAKSIIINVDAVTLIKKFSHKAPFKDKEYGIRIHFYSKLGKGGSDYDRLFDDYENIWYEERHERDQDFEKLLKEIK